MIFAEVLGGKEGLSPRVRGNRMVRIGLIG